MEKRFQTAIFYRYSTAFNALVIGQIQNCRMDPKKLRAEVDVGGPGRALRLPPGNADVHFGNRPPPCAA